MTPRSYQVRIISGRFKGRALRYPSGEQLRPTMQRTRSSVFETLGERVRGAVFVDLYAGAGSMGLEALSRGASAVYLVERDGRALRFLRDNLDRLSLESPEAIVVRSDANDFLAGPFEKINADIVYADPPYQSNDAELLLEFFDSVRYSQKQLVVIEHDKGLRIPELARLERIRDRAFGRTTISYFETAGDKGP